MPTLGHRTRVGTLFGVPVEVTPSWALLLILVFWSFWVRYTTVFRRHSEGVAVAMAVVATALLLGSLLLHELGHAVVGKMRGLRVSSITLYVFGGATTASQPSGPGDELLFTLVGPTVNLVLSLLFWGVTGVADHFHLSGVAQVSGEAGWLNLLLGVFNVVPAAPLDGGHVLEAVVWRMTGDRAKAVRVAGRAGGGLGGGLIALGVLELLFVKDGLFEGLWLALIGYVVLEGSKGEMTRAWIQEVLRDAAAGVLLTEHSPPVTKDTSIRWLLRNEFTYHHVDAVPVEDGGELVGVVVAGDLERARDAGKLEVTVGEVMRPLAEFPKESASSPALAVLDQLGDHPLVILTDPNGRAVGAVSQRQVGLVLERLRSLRTPPIRWGAWGG
ncbi:MAG: site-2 protease family protein [Acidimicrobiales bacterium]